jgi:hypothetical protein
MNTPGSQPIAGMKIDCIVVVRTTRTGSRTFALTPRGRGGESAALAMSSAAGG